MRENMKLLEIFKEKQGNLKEKNVYFLGLGYTDDSIFELYHKKYGEKLDKSEITAMLLDLNRKGLIYFDMPEPEGYYEGDIGYVVRVLNI